VLLKAFYSAIPPAAPITTRLSKAVDLPDLIFTEREIALQPGEHQAVR
jgi:hypothetical protein